MQGNAVSLCCGGGYRLGRSTDDNYDKAKRRKVRQGSLEDVLASQHLPPGPASLHELLCFPEDMLACVFADDKFKSSVMRLLEGGIIETSDYSGVCAAREATRLLLQAILAHTGQEIPCRVRRMCDVDKTSQHVLLHLSRTQDSGEACVFPDIRQQLHLSAQKFLESCAPAPGASSLERMQCYEEMSQWLDENGSWAVCQDRNFSKFCAVTHFCSLRQVIATSCSSCCFSLQALPSHSCLPAGSQDALPPTRPRLRC